MVSFACVDSTIKLEKERKREKKQFDVEKKEHSEKDENNYIIYEFDICSRLQWRFELDRTRKPAACMKN